MEHDQAVASMTAEKYLLGELQGDEREEFEEHFFSCPECAHDMRDLSSIAEGVRLLPNPPPKAEPSKTRVSTWLAGWRPPSLRFGLAYAGALLVVIGFAALQTVESRNEFRPRAVMSFLLRPETRGEPVPIPVEQIGPFLLLEADLPGASGKLQWDLRRTNSNSIIVQDVAAAPSPGASFKVLLPASVLAPAEYALAVHAAAASLEKDWLFRFRIAEKLR